MSLMLRGLLVMATVGALTFPTTVPQSQTTANGSRKRIVQPVNPSAPKVGNFTPDQVEYYMTDDGVAYIRPGVKINLISITNVAAGQNPVVEFTLTDNMNQPLDRKGEVTPGPIAPGFILSAWDPTTREYNALTTRVRSGVVRPSGDQGGKYTDLEIGHYKYTFGTKMPANLSATQTLTLSIYARRTLNDIIGKDYYADNVNKDFRPDGAAPTNTWGSMPNVETTCNKCHDPLGLHGGTRRSVQNCMTCHNGAIGVDTASGESFDAKVFFHKLHRGENLPSVEAGEKYEAGGDWSTVVFPQDIRNCTVCHDSTAKESEVWMTRPSRKACGSCHDDIDWTTGENHPGGPASDDSACNSCHQPDSGQEWDASVKAAHTNPLKSKQLKGLKASIVSVSDMAADKKPTVVFKVTNGDGSAVDASKLSSFSPKLAGNTKSYYKYFSETAAGKGTFDAAAGTTTYTFTNAIPADATGTWTVSADMYRNVNLKRNDGKADIAVREAAVNPIKYADIAGGAAVSRRVSVLITKCNDCHDSLRLHGTQRMVIEECVICHNPVTSDTARRPATANPPESISFQRMIHRIHSGEELTQDFTVYGFGNTAHNYNEVRFPGDRRNCLACHANAAGYAVPVAPGAGPVTTLRDYFSPQGPGTAACLGCHDNENAAAHAYLNTTTFPGATNPSEACGACHSPGKEVGVDKVHAR